MLIFTQSSPQKNDLAAIKTQSCYSEALIGQMDICCTPNLCYTLPMSPEDYQETLQEGAKHWCDVVENEDQLQRNISVIKSASQVADGSWICTTDLLQTDSSKKRPRLLPSDVKMYMYSNSMSNTQEKTNYKRPFSFHYQHLHPKKRFLQRYIVHQKYL